MNVFRWNDWNRGKLEKHGVFIAEAERVANNAHRPYPRYVGGGKWLVIGRGQGDGPIQAVYVVHDKRTLFIIHAMPLTTRRRRG
jgi:uncharacterized DUF497 family protein